MLEATLRKFGLLLNFGPLSSYAKSIGIRITIVQIIVLPTRELCIYNFNERKVLSRTRTAD